MNAIGAAWRRGREGIKVYAFYRLNPRQNPRDKATSMFDLAKATESKLAQGERWGDDYLIVVDEDGKADLVEELMRGDGIYFERVAELPAHHRWHIV